MKTVTIPTCANPFVVIVNGIKYTYPAGATMEVPDDVAEVIEQHEEAKPEPAPVQPPFASVPSEEKVFDLVEMGLPTITQPSVVVKTTCDTTELMRAASKGVIKVKINIQGADVVSVINTNYLGQMNTYQGTFTAYLNGLSVTYVAITPTGVESALYGLQS